MNRNCLTLFVALAFCGPAMAQQQRPTDEQLAFQTQLRNAIAQREQANNQLVDFSAQVAINERAAKEKIVDLEGKLAVLCALPAAKENASCPKPAEVKK